MCTKTTLVQASLLYLEHLIHELELKVRVYY